MAGALAAVLGGVATAAYAGVLPTPVQQVAHTIFGAPRPRPAAGPGNRPDPAGSTRAVPLCTAYAHARDHGTAAQQAVAFRRLAAAAGGPGKVAAYCAAVPSVGASPSAQASAAPAGTATARGGGKPSSPPGKPTGLPTPAGGGKPSSPPGKPTGLPTPHGS